MFPNYLNFASMTVNKQTISKVILSNATDAPIRITKIEIYPDDLILNIKEGMDIPANSDLTLEAKYTPKNIGRFLGNVKLLTNNPDVPELILNGFGSTSEEENK
jgi:hypothetical protein